MKKVAVLGLGKIGALAAELLNDSDFAVVGYDATPVVQPNRFRFPAHRLDVTDGAALDGALEDADAVLSCLPYFLNTGVATAAHRANIHYFDLTEEEMRGLAEFLRWADQTDTQGWPPNDAG